MFSLKKNIYGNFPAVKKIYFILLLTVLFLSGCSLFLAPKVKEFDLDMKINSVPGSVRVAAVRNLSNSGQRFLLRTEKTLTRDPLNIWTTEPGTLICNALNRCFKENKTPAKKVFICDITSFETDIFKNVFRISGNFRRQGTSAVVPFDIAVPIEEHSSESIVRAASSAVEKLAVQLAGTAEK